MCRHTRSCTLLESRSTVPSSWIPGETVQVHQWVSFGTQCLKSGCTMATAPDFCCFESMPVLCSRTQYVEKYKYLRPPSHPCELRSTFLVRPKRHGALIRTLVATLTESLSPTLCPSFIWPCFPFMLTAVAPVIIAAMTQRLAAFNY